MDITALERAYQEGATTPSKVVCDIYAQIESSGLRPVWISLVDAEKNLARAAELERLEDKEKLPLWGIPFAVKDNMDVEGMATTAACPAYARVATQTAHAVQRLLDAGAILIGKTNMDQFATGLVGTRTPYGVCSSVFDADYVSGGSSSGSAVAVASGVVSFSLGTDTAGSGRVPAAFNQLVGLKPTRGLVSTHGVTPACRTLDCVSVFAETCGDASRVLKVIGGFDSKDAYSRAPRYGEGAAPWANAGFRFGVPLREGREFFGDAEAERNFDRAIAALEELGGTAAPFDYEPFRATAQLLYGGAWVAERLAAIEEFIAAHAEQMDPTVASIIASGERLSAADAFRAEYRLRELERATQAVWENADLLVLPTTPTHYRVADVQAQPVELNSRLGYYTNFVNLLDLAAVAVPSGMRGDGLPAGVQLIGRAFTDDGLLLVADRLHRRLATTLGGSSRLLAETPALALASTPPDTPPGCVLMAVVGAHLSGEPLNWQMTQRRARLIGTVRTHGDYRLYRLPNSTPAKPGMVFSPGFAGKGIEVEVWAMPEETVGSFLQGIPAPLSLGTVFLEDGSSVKGFLCEPAGIAGAEEITHLGGWRAYLKSLA
jgi:allophanate hydrolase